ncbi:MAG: hypothetical protein HC802_10720 [Caldilineaceae bacterium]|nr:hypothetical protein [Caldilineaceae bacterium]
MTRRLFDSEYIFGIHEPGGEGYMVEAGRPGWIVFTEAIGADPDDFSGQDYSPYSSRNLGVMARLNNGYSPAGTIPNSAYYEEFAQRCANFVANSRGCKIWIIGNEMNYAIERPPLFSRAAETLDDAEPEPASGESKGLLATARRGAQAVMRNLSAGMGDAQLFSRSVASDADEIVKDALVDDAQLAPLLAPAAESGEVITPEMYARCYALCRQAIHAIPGHSDDQVLIGAVAPWNDQTRYPGNESGDWVVYFQDILDLLGVEQCDGVTIHTYTHGADTNLIYSDAKMDPPFQNRHFNFKAYVDFMQAIPASMRQLPVYITETNQDVPWENRNIGWVQAAYGEINWWNSQPGSQQIHNLILYRWPKIDQWYIEGKAGVIEDFRLALRNNYRWQEPTTPPQSFRAGDIVATTSVVNLRRSPGFLGKPAGDIVAQLPAQTRLSILVTFPKVQMLLSGGRCGPSIAGCKVGSLRPRPTGLH